jgi:hypothetical protein
MFRGYHSELAIFLSSLISNLPIEDLLDFVTHFAGWDRPARLKNTLLTSPNDLKRAFVLSQKEICKRGKNDDIEKLVDCWKTALSFKIEWENILQECLMILSKRDIKGKFLFSCALLRQKASNKQVQINAPLQQFLENFEYASLVDRTREDLATLSLLIDWDCLDIDMNAIAIQLVDALSISHGWKNSIGEWGNTLTAVSALSSYIKTSQLQDIIPIILNILFESRMERNRGVFVTALESLRKLSVKFEQNHPQTSDVLDELLTAFEHDDDNQIGRSLSAHEETVETLIQFIPYFNTYQINTIINKSYANKTFSYYTKDHLKILGELSGFINEEQIILILNKIKLHLKNYNDLDKEFSLLLEKLAPKLTETQINELFTFITELPSLERYWWNMKGLSQRLNQNQIDLVIEKIFASYAAQNSLNYYAPCFLLVKLSSNIRTQQLMHVFSIIHAIIHSQNSTPEQFSAACYLLENLHSKFHDHKIDMTNIFARLYAVKNSNGTNANRATHALRSLYPQLNHEQQESLLSTVLIELIDRSLGHDIYETLEEWIPFLNHVQLMSMFNIFLNLITRHAYINEEKTSSLLTKILFCLEEEHFSKLTDATITRWGYHTHHACPIIDFLAPYLKHEARITFFKQLCEGVNFDNYNTSVLTACLRTQMKLLIHAEPEAIQEIQDYLVEKDANRDSRKLPLLIFMEALPELRKERECGLSVV